MRIFIALSLMIFLSAAPARAQFGVMVPAATGIAAIDTVALQGAVISGRTVLIPNNGTCYAITGLNITNQHDIVFQGEGTGSCIEIAGSAGTNFIDMAGAQRIRWRDLSINGPSSVVPWDVFFWAGTAAAGWVYDLSFDNVKITAYTAVDHLVVYAADRLTIDRSIWTQLQNGPPYSTRGPDPSYSTGVLRIDANNLFSLTSAFTTVATGQQTASDTVITASCFIDKPAGFGGGTQDNNVSVSLVTTGQLEMYGGCIESLGAHDLVISFFSEGLGFHGTKFEASDNSYNASDFIWIGGGLNSNIHLDNSFMSVPINQGMFINLGPPVIRNGALSGGVSKLDIHIPDIGGVMPGGSNHLIGETFGCSSTLSPWIANSSIEVDGQPSAPITVGLWIVGCGDIAKSVTMRGVPGVLLVGGIDYSTKWGP